MQLRFPAVTSAFRIAVEGRDAVMRLLAAALAVFEDFRYLDELHGDAPHALIFGARAGGRELNGLDHLRSDAGGLVCSSGR